MRDESRLKCWKIIPMLRRAAHSCGLLSVVRSTPSTITWPLVGFSSMLTQRISVLFPAPDEPITPKIVPCGMNKLMSFRAWICLSP
ncbi:Uncharacterised protein [Vibrio cholerae]|nr:Uncharacterised protein [Vibrio cholerae]CSC37504.1 Uncharacterised protein [Vibrio cholerae]CSI67614.1 Uncharacterised protein [Vibrio cholerae]